MAASDEPDILDVWERIFAEEDKDTKAEANYRLAESQDRRCAICEYMNDDGSCEKVQGMVKPDHVCDHFEHE